MLCLKTSFSVLEKKKEKKEELMNVNYIFCLRSYKMLSGMKTSGVLHILK